MDLFLGFLSCFISLYVCFLCQCHAVLIIVDLQNSLKSGNVIPIDLFCFVFKISLSVWGHIRFYINLRVRSSSLENLVF